MATSTAIEPSPLISTPQANQKTLEPEPSVKGPGPLEVLLRTRLGWDDRYFSAKPARLQDLAAAGLRQAAVNHLRHSQMPQATHYRDQVESHPAELDRQAQDKEWGEKIHFIALAELLGCQAHVNRTHSYNNTEPLYESCYIPSNPSKHSFSLRLTHNGNHWYPTGQNAASSSSDGNCLYNACALELRRSVMQERRQRLATRAPVSGSAVTIPSHASQQTLCQSTTRFKSALAWTGEALAQGKLKTQTKDVVDPAVALPPNHLSLIQDWQSDLQACSTQAADTDEALAIRLQLEEIKSFLATSPSP